MRPVLRLYALLTFSLLFFGRTDLLSQNSVVKHYSVNEGLPSSECYWVMQDSRHFLWIATDAGVVKYDGYKFITYNSTKGLPDNTVFKIHEDIHGRIWFSTFSGKMAYYLYETDSICSIPANKELSNVVKYLPDDFCFDDKDTLWVSLQLQGFIKIPPPLYATYKYYGLPKQGYFIKELPNGQFIYGFDAQNKYTDDPLPFYFIGTDNKYNEPKPGYKIPPMVTLISAIKTGPHHYLFANDATVFNVTNHSIEKLITYDPAIISLHKDSKNRIWMNTRGNGTFVYKNEQLRELSQTLFPNTIVSCCIEDIDHGYWFTTTTNGIYYMPSLDFKYYNKDCGLTSNKVYNMAVLNNKLYCTVNDSKLNILDLITKTLRFKTDILYSYVFGVDNKLVFNGNPRKALVSPRTKILDLDNNSTVFVKNKLTLRKIALKKATVYDASHLLGFDQTFTLFIIDKITGAAEPIIKIPFRIFSIYKDEDRIFIGTKQGLYKLENTKLSFLGDSIPILTNRIEAITGIGKTLFIATKGVGVLCYKDHHIVTAFNESNGLASNICKCIIKDAENNIWVGTNKGISKLSPDPNGNYSCNTLNLSNGLVSNEINEITTYKDQLYFATNNGIGIVNINEAFDKNKFIPVYIENFSVNNIKHDYKDKQELKYNENYIAINYKGLYLKNEGNITYRYKLEGLDTSWTTTKNTFIQYTTLPAGNYKFIVYAINSNGKAGNKRAIIVFNIQAPFWQTGWFYFLIVISVSGIIYLLYKRRVNAIKKIEAQKTLDNIKIAESELKALRSQMNPHFIFNALNSIQSFVIKNESKDAQKYLIKFSKLIRAVLENSKNETILLATEIDTLQLYLELELLRASFNFNYKINLSETVKRKPIYIPTMIIQPYIENAILHGLLPLTERKGEINITFKEKDSNLICIIDDNGIGREEAWKIKQKKNTNHLSMGMSVTSERIDRLNRFTSTFTFVSIIDKCYNDKPMGTTVTIEIKYNTL